MKKLAMMLLTAGIVAGCGSKSADEQVVYAVIDGHPVTAAMVKEAVLLQAEMAKLRGTPVKDTEFIGWANAQAGALIKPLLNAQLLEGEIERLKIRPEPEDLAQVLASYNRQTGCEAKTAEELASKFGELKAAFLRQFEQSADIAAYARQYWSSKVQDLFVHRYFQTLSNAVNFAVKADALAKTHAEAAYARLKAGEKWAKVAAECSEDKLICAANEKFSKEWAWVGNDAMGIEELAAELPKMKVGDFTRPLDTHDGMLIIRLEEKLGKTYRLSRILFRMGQKVKIPKSFEDARKDLEGQLAASQREATLKRLAAAAQITYPMGTNVNYQIWRAPDK